MSGSGNAQPARPRPDLGLVRPRLDPALRQLWRDPATLQLGIDPARALVIHDIDPATRVLLGGLDGRHTTTELLTESQASGGDPDAAHQLLCALAGCRVLIEGSPTAFDGLGGPAEVERMLPDLASLALLARDGGPTAPARLRRRKAAQVVVHGATRVGVPLASIVAAAGVGRVAVIDSGTAGLADAAPGGVLPADEQRPRLAAAADAVRRAAPATDGGIEPGDRPDLVVLCDPWPSTAERCAPWQASGTAHLIVAVAETTAVVGPLVLPGRTSCVGCADLHRTDRDPAWPTILAQLTRRTARATDPLDGPLAVLAAAAGAMQALAYLDGRDAPAVRDATLELTLPDWRLRRRSWPPHPACHCRQGLPLSAGRH